MIRHDEDLAVQKELLGCLERALDDLRADVYPKNPRNFAIYAEGYIDEINKLKAEIDEYLARRQGTTPTTAAAPTTPDPTAVS
ncbi:MAG: hypothetical protein HY289_02610 [Planctomycetes bacterium]|nr:hypothetical protein [Planctomycetota bacterium]